MQNSYKCVTSIAKKDSILLIVLFCLLMFCVIPSFTNIGNIVLQIISTVFLASIVSLAVLHIKNGLKVTAVALNIYIVAWVIFAICGETYLQIRNHINGVPFHGWIYFFYYDKSMTVGLVWVSVMTVFTACRIKLKRFQNENAANEYIQFFNISSRGFLLFYILLLFYSFIIIRDIGSHPSVPNFIPFHMIAQYARINNYETFMIFFGNFLLFLPFGFYSLVILQKRKWILFLLPVIISTVIELSQLLLKNGNCDIDDVILNSAGFFLGVLLKISIDKFISLKTDGSEKTVFIWQPYSLFSLRTRH